MKNNLTGSLCTVNSGMLNNHNGMISKLSVILVQRLMCI